MNYTFTILFLSLLLMACSGASVEEKPSSLGQPAAEATMLESIQNGVKVKFEKITAANWAVALSGLTNLDDPKAKAAGLKDREEPIEIYVYKISHPKFGTFLIDSGVAERFREPSQADEISWLVHRAMNLKRLKTEKTTQAIVSESGGIQGVFLTHIHLDHILGLPDLWEVPVYTGPGEASKTRLTNFATRGTTDRIMKAVDSLNELNFGDGWVNDIFGDGSVWALHVPGHTPGSVAFLVNTEASPQLIVGDATHTSWGWMNTVPAGSFSDDIALSQLSLDKLKALEKKVSSLQVHPGHQALN